MQLRYYQTEAVDALINFLMSHRGCDLNGKPKPENPVIGMPTGTGKSLTIAEFVRRAISIAPQTRILMAVHVKELVEGNAAELMQLLPGASVGIVSAGLRKRQLEMPITFGGVGTLINCADKLGRIDIMIVDECHLISPEEKTRYAKLIGILQLTNPYIRVIGFSATLYRQKLGQLTNGGIFTHNIYDITGIDSFNRLIFEGFICRLAARPTKLRLDVSGVSKTAEDFNAAELQAAVDKDETTHAALIELCELGWQRQSWLIFCAGIEHAEHCAEKLRSFGVSCEALHSKNSNKQRDDILARYKSGKLRAICNNGVLTTGFNHPPLDLIGMLRPTSSTSLWVQMLGRGTRPYDGTKNPAFPNVKQNCLVLDFAGNTERLGPINDPVIPKHRKKGDPGDMPIKICNKCGTYNHTRATNCTECGNEFIFEEKIDRTASTAEVMVTNVPEYATFAVDRVTFGRHNKRIKPGDAESPPTLKVTYYNGFKVFHEWVALEHDGIAYGRAKDWWRQRAGTDAEIPATIFEALQQTSNLKIPKAITVQTNAKPMPRITEYDW